MNAQLTFNDFYFNKCIRKTLLVKNTDERKEDYEI